MCGFDSDFSQSVNRKVFQAVSYTKLESDLNLILMLIINVIILSSGAAMSVA